MGLQYQLNSSTINMPPITDDEVITQEEVEETTPEENNGGNKRRGQRINFAFLMRSTPTGQIQNIMVFLSSLQQKNIRISEDKNRKSTNSFYPKKPITINDLQKCADGNTTMSFGSIKN